MKKHWYIMIPALSGLCFLLWLASCARLTYDDYLFAACFKTHSFAEAISILANTHTFRWTTFLLQDLVLGLVPGKYFPISIFCFFLIFYAVWIWQMHKLIRMVVHKFLQVTIDATTLFSLATLFIVALYFATSQAVETFTFHGAVCDRLVPLLFITIALNLLLGPNKGWGTFLQLGLVALLIAGTAENVTITLVLALLLFLARNRFVAREKIHTAVLFFTIELMIFLGMELLSPGSDARYQAEKVYRFTCGPDNSYCADTLTLFLSRFFPTRELLAIPFLLVFFGVVASLQAETKDVVRPLAKRVFLFLLVVLLPAVLFHLVSVQWIFNCYGPMRIWFPINVLLVLLGVATMVYFGSSEWRAPSISRVASVILSMAVLMFYLGRHYNPTSAYKSAYDDRIESLQRDHVSDSLVEVDPLPPADLVVEGDIMENPDDDVNRDFANAYGLSFKVKKK
jgi:hypothetical protein